MYRITFIGLILLFVEGVTCAMAPSQNMAAGPRGRSPQGNVSPQPSKKKWHAPVTKGKEPGTLDLTRGNWYEKKMYYTKAREVYEQIKKLAAAVEKRKAPFLTKRSENEEKLAQFNHDIGIKENEVDELLETAKKELQEERAREINLTESERDLLEDVRERKRDLEQLKADIKGIGEYNELLDKAIATVREQSKTVRSFEREAGRAYNQIAKEINDRIAEQLFLSMKTYLENITAIDSYLQHKLFPFFTGKISDIDDKINAAKAKVMRLKARGVIITKKIEADEEEDKKRQAARQKQREEELRRKKAATYTWYQRLWDKIKAPYVWFARLLGLIK